MWCNWIFSTGIMLRWPVVNVLEKMETQSEIVVSSPLLSNFLLYIEPAVIINRSYIALLLLLTSPWVALQTTSATLPLPMVVALGPTATAAVIGTVRHSRSTGAHAVIQATTAISLSLIRSCAQGLYSVGPCHLKVSFLNFIFYLFV
jgi:hypothetical protein